MKFTIGITTYNRADYLKRLVNSFLATIKDLSNWQMIIVDDGSTDETEEYLSGIRKFNSLPIHIERVFRMGVHNNTNTIFDLAFNRYNTDLLFKCDDDIWFEKTGWVEGYLKVMELSGYEHIAYFNKEWKNSNQKFILEHPTLPLTAYGRAYDCQGAFYTVTKSVFKKVGYMDYINMGFRGIGHIDFSMRCCRAGFNDMDSFWDWRYSNQHIKMYSAGEYRHSLPDSEIMKYRADQSKKVALLHNNDRIFIPFIK